MVQRVRKLAVKLLMILLVVCSVIGLSLAMSGCATETKSIDSFVINAEGQLVVTYTDGTSTPLGKVTADDAKGITKAEINDKGELVITYTDGSSENLGVVSGQTGNGIQGIATSADGTKLVITLTNGETVEVAIPDFSCDHEQMWKDGEYDIVELGEHGRIVDEDGVETFTKTSYIVTYHCNGGHDANSDAGHAEILVNVDPIHNENTMVRRHVYATCEEAGYNGIVCGCGYAMDKEYIESEPAIGHTWSKTYLSKIDDLPYCTHGAFVTQECQNYFHADGSYHDAAPDEKCDNPNCDVASVKQDETARVVGTVEPIGHHAAAYDITKTPTYTEKGEATGVCMFCNQEFTTELPTIYQRGIIDTIEREIVLRMAVRTVLHRQIDISAAHLAQEYRNGIIACGRGIAVGRVILDIPCHGEHQPAEVESRGIFVRHGLRRPQHASVDTLLVEQGAVYRGVDDLHRCKA